MIKKLLKLSTAHVPSEDADWQDACVQRHEHGWILWVTKYEAEDYGSLRCESVRLPTWLRPVMDLAYNKGCELVLFDCNAKNRADLPTWDW